MKIFVNIVLFVGFSFCLFAGIYTITEDIDKTFKAITLLSFAFIAITFAKEFNKE